MTACSLIFRSNSSMARCPLFAMNLLALSVAQFFSKWTHSPLKRRKFAGSAAAALTFYSIVISEISPEQRQGYFVPITKEEVRGGGRSICCTWDRPACSIQSLISLKL